MQLPYTKDLQGVDVAVLGIPFDTGSPFRVGCRFGASAVRTMSLIPGGSDPRAGGPSARDVLRLLRSLRGLDRAGADVVEMNPNYDPGQISALLAATVVAEILALIAAHRRDHR
jgi:arginase family enzyme